MSIHSSAWQRIRLAVLERDEWTCRVLVDPKDPRAWPLAEQVDRTRGREHGVPLERVDKRSPRAATVDHIVARARGGSDHSSNLQAACRTCNGRRSALDTNTGRTRPLNTSGRW